MMHPIIAFHFDLVQDVSVLRPVVRLASGTMSEVVLFVSPQLARLDPGGFWRNEIEILGRDAGATVIAYQSELDVFQVLARRKGICIAGSESNVPAHARTHHLFRAMPAGILRITLQHGFECLGFLHNARHSAAFGRDIRFAADIIVGWLAKDRLYDVAPSETGKLYVAGPMMLIDQPSGRLNDITKARSDDPYCGLVCENTHSARFHSKAMKASFLSLTEALAKRIEPLGKILYFRPHPAGEFVNKTGYKAPPSIKIEDAPLYTLDLTRYCFAISAPSTILLDFMLADVPVAVWGGKSIDAANFAGLVGVENEEDAWQFVVASATDRTLLLDNQRRFLNGLGVPTQIRERYQALLALASA